MQAEPAEPKVDGRRKAADPALFDLPVQEPPVEPGVSKAAYVDFDALFVRIMTDRVPIRADKQSNGSSSFSVPSLTDKDQRLLRNPRFAHRALQRIKAIYAKQQNEVERLVRWVATQGHNPDLLKLDNRTASLGSTVTDSVRTLFKHWGRHENVIAALRTESESRVARAAELAKAPPVVAAVVDEDREQRRAEADQLYPMPDQAFTEPVEQFIRLLRDAAPIEQLREAADKIHADPRAREDINRHNVHLATAYRQFLEGVGQRVAQRERDQKHAER